MATPSFPSISDVHKGTPQGAVSAGKDASDDDAESDYRQHVVSISAITTAIGGQIIHRDLSLSVFRGEILGVIGNSGSGKSLLLRAIMGLLAPLSGTIRLFGEDIYAARHEDRTLINRRCGVLFQANALFSSLTVAENVAVPLRMLTNISELTINELVRLKILLSGLPLDAAEKYPDELSGGMQKRAALARAIAVDPDLLLLDEPTTGLDPLMAEQIDDLINTIVRTMGMTAMLVTHDVDTLFTVCDRVAALVDGSIVALSPPRELARSDHPWVRQYLSAHPRRYISMTDSVRKGRT
ncbi:ATP-binding cassette domain-containing protein [Ochrobactrum sp. BD22]